MEEAILNSKQFQAALVNERDEAKEMANWDEFPHLNEGVTTTAEAVAPKTG